MKLKFAEKFDVFHYPTIFIGTVTFISIFLSWKLGVHSLSNYFDSTPERLRDITYPIWSTSPWQQHGFFVYLTNEDFINRIAYTGHTPFYAMLMWPVVLISKTIGVPHKAIGALLPILLLSAVLVRIAKSQQEKLKISGNSASTLLFATAIMFLMTSPFYWISLTKFNFDNALYYIIGPLLLLSYEMASTKKRKLDLWASALFIFFISPLVLSMLGLAVAVYSFFLAPEEEKKHTRYWGSAFLGVGMMGFSLTRAWANLLGLSSSSSSWAFRSGLDGDTTYFQNVFQAVFAPYYPRKLLPIAIVFIITYMAYRLMNSKNKNTEKNDLDIKLLFFGLLSTYAITLLLWPQAVSIHPYLYDMFFIFPAYIAILLLCTSNANWNRISVFFMFLALCFGVQSNLIFISQVANCPMCSN